MNPVLREIIDTRLVRTADGQGTIPLHSNVSEDEGKALQALVASIAPTTSLEIGLAYGTSALFICDVLKPGARHIVVDPNQHGGPWGNEWQGIGMANLKRAGYSSMIDFRGEPSFRALPALEREGTKLDFAFIDGLHTFDYVMTDFFFVDRMLRVGGIVAFDDADWPAIRKVCRFVARNLHYSVATSYDPKGDGEGLLRKSIVGMGHKSARIARALRPELLYSDRALKLSGSLIAFRKEQDDDRVARRIWDHWEEF